MENFLQLKKCMHLEDEVYQAAITWHYDSLASGNGIVQKRLWQWGGGDSYGCLEKCLCDRLNLLWK